MIVRIGLIFVLLALVVSGCGGDDESSGGEETSGGDGDVVTLPPDPDDNSPDPTSQQCVEAWNAGSNKNAQGDLEGVFADGESGNIFVGTGDGFCILGYRTDSNPDVATYVQAGKAFERAEVLPADQYETYPQSIGAIDVVLQPAGVVAPA